MRTAVPHKEKQDLLRQCAHSTCFCHWPHGSASRAWPLKAFACCIICAPQCLTRRTTLAAQMRSLNVLLSLASRLSLTGLATRLRTHAYLTVFCLMAVPLHQLLSQRLSRPGARTRQDTSCWLQQLRHKQHTLLSHATVRSNGISHKL